jgi:hypothetical protein
VAGCNTPLSPTDRPSKINKETSELNDNMDQMDLQNIPPNSYRIHILLKKSMEFSPK